MYVCMYVFVAVNLPDAELMQLDPEDMVAKMDEKGFFSLSESRCFVRVFACECTLA